MTEDEKLTVVIEDYEDALGRLVCNVSVTGSNPTKVLGAYKEIRNGLKEEIKE